MLSAKRIKQHGMSSKRWTTKDKLTQYKGLLNLYVRDRKILDYDLNAKKKKTTALLKELQSNIAQYRDELDNATRGNKQALRNVLQDHKELQMAYQNLHPTKVIEKIFQSNFNKRKELDRLNYTLQKRSDELIRLKLEAADLEDRLKIVSMYGQIKEEELAQIITGKVQDAILRRDAAIVVSNTYKSILNIMKRDAIYFDAILETIKNDAMAQGKCMYRTTELGQLATEYLDDRKDEFLELENEIKAEMKIREADLEVIRNKVASLGSNLRFLIRRDSDITMVRHVVQKTESMNTLQSDIDFFTNILYRLKDFVRVPNFDLIFPCLEQQKMQAERLSLYLQERLRLRDLLDNKCNHGKKMLSTLTFTMVDTTFEYRNTKKEILTGLEVCQHDKEKLRSVIQKKGELITSIRTSLQHIYHLCKHVNTDKHDKHEHDNDENAEVEERQKSQEETNHFEKYGGQLIAKITEKLQILLPQVSKFPESVQHNLLKNYEKMLHMFTTVINPVPSQTYESLVEWQLDDLKLPSRESIKAQSDEIVRQHMRQLHRDELAVPRLPKRRKFK